MRPLAVGPPTERLPVSILHKAYSSKKGRGGGHGAVRNLQAERRQRQRRRSDHHLCAVPWIEDGTVTGTYECVAILGPCVDRAALVSADAGIGDDALG